MEKILFKTGDLVIPKEGLDGSIGIHFQDVKVMEIIDIKDINACNPHVRVKVLEGIARMRNGRPYGTPFHIYINNIELAATEDYEIY